PNEAAPKTKPAPKAKPKPAPKPTTLAGLEAQIAAVLAGPAGACFSALDALDPWAIDDDFEAAQDAIASANRDLIARAAADLAVRRAMLASLQTRGAPPLERIEALAELGEPEAFALVRDAATRQLDREYHDTMPEWLYALARFGRSPAHADAAREL